MTECPECKSDNVSYIIDVECSGSYKHTLYQCDNCKKVFADY